MPLLNYDMRIMFARFNRLPNLKVSKSPTGRKLHGGRNDAITDLLAGCDSPAKIAHVAHKFGMDRADINQKASNASGFGQFRMAIGNKLRGICTRLEHAQRSGKKLSIKKAASNR